MEQYTAEILFVLVFNILEMVFNESSKPRRDNPITFAHFLKYPGLHLEKNC